MTQRLYGYEVEMWYRNHELLDWLLRQPAVKAQAYFWNHSSRSERKKAMQKDMLKEADK